MKKLIFITQSKGGAGKSILSFLLAEKYPEAIIMDMDDATKTTTLQLAYRHPLPVTFLDANNVIDRGLFNSFLEKVSTSKSELFIADLGASISEQLPFYLIDVNEFLPDLLVDLGIHLELYNIVGGGNIFTQTMGYLKEVVDTANNQFNIKILQNNYYEFSSDQNQLLEEFASLHQLEIIPFNISRDKNQSTQDRIREVLKSGQGISSASPFSKAYFKQAIKNLAV
jgi:cellulose biosynthesis protein BcsQ